MQDCIRKRMSVGIMLRDALTNRIIESSNIQVFVNGSLPDFQKERKYYIFENLSIKHLEVRIVSELYEERICETGLEQCSREKPVMISRNCLLSYVCGMPLLSISLYPGRHYHLPTGYKRIEWTETPGNVISVIQNQKDFFLLTEEYQGGDIMHILLPDNTNADGLHLRVMDKKNREQYDDFIVLQKKEGDCCLIDHKLNGRYERGSRIYQMYCVEADRRPNTTPFRTNQG